MRQARMESASLCYSDFFCVASSRMGLRIRNDEVVGSSPTSSTKFSITYKFSVDSFCPILSHKTISGPAGVASAPKEKHAL